MQRAGVAQVLQAVDGRRSGLWRRRRERAARRRARPIRAARRLQQRARRGEGRDAAAVSSALAGRVRHQAQRCATRLPLAGARRVAQTRAHAAVRVEHRRHAGHERRRIGGACASVKHSCHAVEQLVAYRWVALRVKLHERQHVVAAARARGGRKRNHTVKPLWEPQWLLPLRCAGSSRRTRCLAGPFGLPRRGRG